MELPESILTKYRGVSPISHNPADYSYILIQNNGNEEKAKEDRLFLPLKKTEYNGSNTGRVWQIYGNPMAEKLATILGQIVWEKHTIAETGCTEEEARKRFRERYGTDFT